LTALKILNFEVRKLKLKIEIQLGLSKAVLISKLWELMSGCPLIKHHNQLHIIQAQTLYQFMKQELYKFLL